MRTTAVRSPTLSANAAEIDADSGDGEEVTIRNHASAWDAPPGRSHGLLLERDLPRPPTDRPARYMAWLASQPSWARAEIDAFCAAPENRTTYRRACGGIGPLHIPVPPYAWMRRPGGAPDPWAPPASYFASERQWLAALTPAQRQYEKHECPYMDEGRPSSHLCGMNTPLVISFAGDAIEYSTGGRFAFQPGDAVGTDWPTASTPWLVLDRDGNGAIDSGRELFGSDTRLAGGRTAAHGFAALAELDDDGNGRIDRDDAAFASLQLWSDRDGDQQSAPDELRPASDVLVSISLSYSVDVRCDARGNCERERATVVWRDATGEHHEGAVVDVYLPSR